MLNKKGAMFGLDARIALAIFGALSVISGAALYSAIQQSKVTSLLVEMNELGKAVEQYMLDTGQNIPLWNPTSTVVTALYQELLTSSVTGWAGPYYDKPVDGTYIYRYIHSEYEYGHVYYLEENLLWGEDEHWAGYGCGNSSFTGYCPIWIFISKVDKSIVEALDNQIDGGDGGKKGRLKYTYPTGLATDPKWHVFYKVVQKM